MANSTSADAVHAVTALLERSRPSGDRKRPTFEATLPTAALQQTLADLTDAQSAEELMSRRPDMKALLVQALDWCEPTSTRATKPVVKAISTALLDHAPDGETAYGQAVEMVSFLSMWAPLLEPDRLARVAAHAALTPLAYAPTRYGLGPSGQLRLMLSHFSEERREALACSLWDEAHGGRWWQHTTGDHHVRNDGRRTRSTRRNKASDEERQAIGEQIDSLLGAHGAPTAALLTTAIGTGALSYSHDTADLVRRTPEPSARHRRELVEAVQRSGDEDHRSLVATLPWLSPAERPESPVSAMIALLLTVTGGPSEFTPSKLPSKPTSFAHLFPEASQELFGCAPEIHSMTGTRMPNLAGADMILIKNPQMLKRNGTYMGNCTFSKLKSCIEGSYVLISFRHLGMDYNASFTRQSATGTYRVTEVRPRFNRGAVSAAVMDSCARLATAFTAATTKPVRLRDATPATA